MDNPEWVAYTHGAARDCWVPIDLSRGLDDQGKCRDRDALAD